MSGDIESNPGPSLCTLCAKTVRKNSKLVTCCRCQQKTHLRFVDPKRNSTITDWMCSQCLPSVLPFSSVRDLSLIDQEIQQEQFQDLQFEKLNENRHLFSIAHINTQSMVSTFDEFVLFVNKYKFDAVTLTETWLKDNPFLLDYVKIEGYKLYYHNRDNRRGGGVGIYIKDDIKHKMRKDITNINPALEHLWVEIEGKNKHSKLLLNVTYQPNFTNQEKADWLESFDRIVGTAILDWTGNVVITGDFNIDLLSNSQIKDFYLETLRSFDLTQHVKSPSRKGVSLIDHISTNSSCKVKFCEVLPTPEISDHDAVFACLNTRVARFEPRYKVIRDMRNFNLSTYVADASTLPFNLVYATDCTDDSLSTLNHLLFECIERHAPLKRIKVTRPQAPWMKDLQINDLQQSCHEKRTTAHRTQSDSDWNEFRDARNALKRKIKHTKKTFYRRLLSSKKPKEVWRLIHRILNPTKSVINIQPSVLNAHYLSTAPRILGSQPTSTEEIQHLLRNFVTEVDQEFEFQPVTYDQVVKEIKNLRSDCSAGYDNLPVSLIKPIADHLASPLTHIINTGIAQTTFHQQWKIGKVTPIPKTEQSVTPDQFRPVTVLPILSKLYERLMAKQIVEYVERNQIYQQTMSGFRKRHSTETLLMKMRDDIIGAMNKSEVTLAAFLDYSKAFDTVDYKTLLVKLRKIGFSNSATMLMLSYLSNRRQFVQIDDKKSDYGTVSFGVPQGSILGPILFDLYTVDLQDNVDGESTNQYADDTTIYEHCKTVNLPASIVNLTHRLNQLREWSTTNNLAFNNKKTKIMLLSTLRMSNLHDFMNPDHATFHIYHSDQLIERVTVYKLLGIQFDQNLNWETHIDKLCQSVYAKLYVLRYLRRKATFRLRKQLAEALLISKLHYCCSLFWNLPQIQLKKLDKLLCRIAAFVTLRYSTIEDVVQLGWLPIQQQIHFELLKLAHKSIHQDEFPSYLKGFKLRVAGRNIRNIEEVESKYETNVSEKLFVGKASRLLNDIPKTIREEPDHKKFRNILKKYLLDRSLAIFFTHYI